MEIREILATKFLEFQGVNKPENLQDKDLIHYLKYYLDDYWGGSVCRILENASKLEKGLIFNFIRKALATGQKIHVWQSLENDCEGYYNRPRIDYILKLK